MKMLEVQAGLGTGVKNNIPSQVPDRNHLEHRTFGPGKAFHHFSSFFDPGGDGLNQFAS